MKHSKVLLFLPVAVILTLGYGCCKTDDDPHSARYGDVEIVLNNTPFKTEKYLRIPYMLKTWEFKKDGLTMQKIVILDDMTKVELQTLEKADFPKIYEDPLPANPYFTEDKLDSYYFSLQLPVLLDQTPPVRVSHRFYFRDTLQNKDVMIEGGTFVPEYDETPVAIASPVKGTNWIFFNQSSNGYHFYSAFFMNGKIGTGERFAFDNLQVNDDMTETHEGDHLLNTSYYNYGDTLFAVADGILIASVDSMPENNGDAHNITFTAAMELAGNYLIFDIGNGRYAFYAHCIPHSFFVETGDTVKEGDPVGLLGNSGNSTEPHLHFQIGDAPDFFMNNGIPFVIKKYTKIGEYMTGSTGTPTEYMNAMMEECTVMKFD